jgi:hypothetical protein
VEGYGRDQDTRTAQRLVGCEVEAERGDIEDDADPVPDRLRGIIVPA